MRIIRRNRENIDQFWKAYWQRVPRDPDHISDAGIYPLFPVDEYVRPDMRILEAGCGMGRVFKHYFHQGRDIIGLEFDHACLARLGRENPAFPLCCADARHLPFGDESMDMAMAFGLLSSIEHGQEAALAELRRVLRPSGLLCASVACDTVLRRTQNLAGWCGHAVRRLLGRPGNRHFFARAYRPREWGRVLEGAGFEVIRTEPTHSRVLLWQYLPFLRDGTHDLDMTCARDGDVGYRLKGVGERLFQTARRHCPWLIAVGVVCMARKV